jgi:hypothetical protein
MKQYSANRSAREFLKGKICGGKWIQRQVIGVAECVC